MPIPATITKKDTTIPLVLAKKLDPVSGMRPAVFHSLYWVSKTGKTQKKREKEGIRGDSSSIATHPLVRTQYIDILLYSSFQKPWPSQLFFLARTITCEVSATPAHLPKWMHKRPLSSYPKGKQDFLHNFISPEDVNYFPSFSATYYKVSSRFSDLNTEKWVFQCALARLK